MPSDPKNAAAGELREGIYVASKCRHAPRWRALRAAGVPIISSWIDQAGDGETDDFAALWSGNVAEAAGARAVVLYHEAGDVLRGAFIEAGAALAAGKPVFIVSPAPDGDKGELGSFHLHPLARRCANVDEAFAAALATPPDPAASQGEAGLREALEAIRYGYADQDTSHADFRVRAYELAVAALSAPPVSDTAGEARDRDVVLLRELRARLQRQARGGLDQDAALRHLWSQEADALGRVLAAPPPPATVKTPSAFMRGEGDPAAGAAEGLTAAHPQNAAHDAWVARGARDDWSAFLEGCLAARQGEPAAGVEGE